MKPTKYYPSLNSLYMTQEYSVPSNKCTKITIEHFIDARHIILAIMGVMDVVFDDNLKELVVKEKRITKKMVEEELRKSIKYKGDDLIEDIESNQITSQSDRNIMMKAVRIAEDLYPEFMGVSNAEKFIKNIK